MNIIFKLNDNIDLTQVTDSMLLDSNQTIATMWVGDMVAFIEVCGSVVVWWKENEDEDDKEELYTTPSEFPESLKRLISEEHYWTEDPRVTVSENNWFELFVGREKSGDVHSDVVEVGGCDSTELFSLLYYSITTGQ